MNINGLNLNLHNLETPRSRQEVIVMLEEACAQLVLMNECMANRISSMQACESA
ncbi:hypothetical protein [Luteibacter yeojuensis]